MRQLNPWDAAFLYGESRVAPMNICSVAHFSPGPDGQRLTLGEVRSAVMRNLHRLPPFRQRVIHAPFGLTRPHWTEDPDLNVDGHLYEVSLSAPGDSGQLAEQVSLIAARPLDLTRPLWEIHLITGLENGETAMVTKFHHAAVDGGSAGEIMPILLDPAPDSAQTTVCNGQDAAARTGRRRPLSTRRDALPAADDEPPAEHARAGPCSRPGDRAPRSRRRGGRPPPRLATSGVRGSPHPIQREAFAKPLLGLWPSTTRPG
jgi:WS/DGAT/MGAT family acyltransferase